MATTTKAVAVTAMPSATLSMLALAFMPTITTSPSALPLTSRAMASRTPHRASSHVPAHAPIVAITEYYTSASFKPVWAIATACQTGHATNIITGWAVPLRAHTGQSFMALVVPMDTVAGTAPLRHAAACALYAPVAHAPFSSSSHQRGVCW